MPYFLPQQTRISRGLLFSLGFGMMISAQPGFAEEVSTEEWKISADKVTRYDNPQSIVAEGNIILKKIRRLPPQPPAKNKVTEWSELLGENYAEKESSAEEIVNNKKPVEKTEVTIRADWIAYDLTMKSIKARGNIQIESAEDTLHADKADINLSGETGSFSNATIIRREKDLHFEGKKIKKTGVNTYFIEDGWAITCKVKDGEVPPWSIASSETTIEPGGYAVMKHARFRIRNIPVLYSPYLIVPIKNTRQTGFLFPEFSHSSDNGTGFNFPFFINLSESADITLYPEYYTGRGAMPGAEFRYVYSEDSKGTFMGSYLDDKLSDPSEEEYYDDTGFTHTNSDRYWFRGKVDHSFSPSLIAKADLDLVSDRDYLTEFNNGVTGFSKTNKRFIEVFGRGFDNKTEDERENSLKLLKSWSGMSLEAGLLVIDDTRPDEGEYIITTETTSADGVTATDSYTASSLDDIVLGTHIDPVTGEEVTVKAAKRTSSPWKLPSLEFTGSRDIGDTIFTLGWNTDYVNFYREEGVSGQRVDLHPVVSSAIPAGQYLESRAEVGLRETYYYAIDANGESTWDESGSQNRLLFDLFTEVGTTLVKDFGSGSNGFTHEARPYIEYAFIPDVDQDDLPYFDRVDRIEQENGITYGVDNFFNLLDKSERELGYFKIYQSLSFLSEYSDEPFSDINAELGWTPIDKINISYKTRMDIYDGGFPYHYFGGSLYNSWGDQFAVDYSYNEDADIEQLNGYVKARLMSRWIFEAGVEHSISEGETNEGNVGLTYQALCWSLEFKTRYTPFDTTYMMTFNLANIGVPLGISL